MPILVYPIQLVNISTEEFSFKLTYSPVVNPIKVDGTIVNGINFV